MTDSVKKNYTIKNAASSDIDSFKELQEKSKLSQAGTFAFCVEAATKPNVNQVDTESLLSRIQALTEENQGLQTQNTGLQETNTGLTLQVETLTSELTEAQNAGKLTGNQFIMEPDEQLYKNMHRAILYLIKKGKFDKTSKTLAAKFTELCIIYTINDDFSHVLK